jgi:hypothetical protein
VGLQAFTFHLAFDVEAFSDHLLDLLVIRTEIKGQVLMDRGELLQGSTAMSQGVASRQLSEWERRKGKVQFQSAEPFAEVILTGTSEIAADCVRKKLPADSWLSVFSNSFLKRR